MSGGRERMGKRSPGWWRRLKEWMGEQATTAFWLALLALLVLLFWVAFGSDDDCGSHCICWLLGVGDKTDAISRLGLAIAGIGALLGVVVANRRAKALADSATAANNTAKATEAGNRQQAFKDGVEHLGSDKAFVRQGGARALFHLALEDKYLRESIANFLCEHIRETTGKKDYQEEYKDKPSAEMQSLLRLLFTTETAGEERLAGFWKDITPDLEGGYFHGVELDNARFQGARLRSAQFQGASLDKAQFQKASLDKTQFNDASLTEAQFQGAWLREAQFQRALLGEAQFQGAWLREAQFQRARLGRAQFQGARLGRAQFQGAWLEKSQFQGASLDRSQFQGTLLWDAQFQGTSLREAQFQGAGLKEAQFQGASLERAQFQGASLEKARFQVTSLERAQFQGASLEGARFQGASLEGSQFQGVWLHMAGFQQAKFGQGPEHEGISAQDHTAANSDELVEELKASAFHGVSSELVRKSFGERVNDRTGKASDFSGVIFSGGVTKELLAEVKEALELVPWLFDDPDFKEKLVRGLELEIDQPESHKPPKDVISDSYGKEDAARWIREFREAMATVPETNQAAQRSPASP